VAFWGPTWWQRAKRLRGVEREAGGRKDGGAEGGGERSGGQEEKGGRREERGRGSRSGGEECKEEEEWRRLATHNLHIPRQRLRSVLLDALLALQPDAVVCGDRIAHVQETDADECLAKCSQKGADVQEIETDECLEKCSQNGGARIAHVQQIHADENTSHVQETDAAECLEKGAVTEWLRRARDRRRRRGRRSC
jgi:hypothetical protein